jgi:hypothetical protein
MKCTVYIFLHFYLLNYVCLCCKCFSDKLLAVVKKVNGCAPAEICHGSPRYCCSFCSPAPEIYITGLLGVTELDHHHQPRTVLSHYAHLIPIPPDCSPLFLSLLLPGPLVLLAPVLLYVCLGGVNKPPITYSCTCLQSLDKVTKSN